MRKWFLRTVRIKNFFLSFQYVKSGSAQPVVFQCIEQCFRIDKRAACGVDQNSVLFHHFELFFTDEVVRIGVERYMERDDIALFKQFMQRHAVRTAIDVANQYMTAKGAESLDDGASDMPCAYNADRHAAQFSSADGRQAEVIVRHLLQRGFCAAQRHQYQHQRIVGDSVRRICHIFNSDSEFSGGFGIDMVIPDAAGAEVCDTGFLQRG